MTSHFLARVLLSALFALSALPVAATDGELAVGMDSESTLVVVFLRLFAAVWGLVLLGHGWRMGRAVMATFLLAVGLPIGAAAAGSLGYLPAAAIAFAVLGIGMAVYVLAPRVAVGLACVWPLPAVYVAHLFFSGSFDRSIVLALLLAAAGVALGACLPRFGLILLSAALGTVFTGLAIPLEWSFSMLVVLLLTGVLWQSTQLLGASADERHEVVPTKAAPRTTLWLQALARGTVSVLALALATVLLAPQYGPGTGPHPHRVARLVEAGSLTRPGFVLQVENNYYLSGRAVPIALLSNRPGLAARFATLLVGRSPMTATRELRAVKEEQELERMRRAAAITSRTFADIRPLIRPGVSEAEVERAIVDSFRRNGATGVAFTSVVGSGANAVKPHYMNNDAIMSRGLVVIDIGCSVDHYASDMTRTFPVAGEVTPAEQHLVDTVVAAGDAARAILTPGVTMRELDQVSRAVIEEAGFGPYYLHSVGHHVGLHVHDPHRNQLQAGMVITIEPGIYIGAGADVDPAYWNLGVRIEDSYIVTEEGYEEITSYPRVP